MGKVAYSTLSTMRSLLTDDYEHCINCGGRATDCHHIFEGPDKRWSEEYELMVPMCSRCHHQLHFEYEMNLHYKKIAQEAFEDKYPDKEFIKIFRRNYR